MNPKFKYFLLHFSRLLVGAVFVFSGFVKGVDPLGTAFKLHDYFNAYGTTWANDLALPLSILLCTFEFFLGTALIFSIFIRLSAWMLLVTMSFFTLLTFYDALYAPVSDCGCFGDAIKLTNWETFYKNVILMFPTLVIFYNRGQYRPLFTLRLQGIFAAIVTGAFVWMSVYQYQHEPFIDFRPWKVGNRMLPDPDAEMRVYVKYKNKDTGELREYLSPNFPWNDSAWMAAWEFIDQRIEYDGKHIVHGLMAEDEFGNDFTNYLLGSDAMFVLVAWDAPAAPDRAWHKVSILLEMLTEANQNVAMLTASLPEEIRKIFEKYNIEVDAFYADGTTLKTMIRSNPGLVLFHKGYVAGKWHFNNFPRPSDLPGILQSLDDFQKNKKP